MVDAGYVLAGSLTGFMVGLTGVGGGALMTPYLADLLWRAAYCSDCYRPVVCGNHEAWLARGCIDMRGSVDWHVAKLLWLGSLPMAALIVGMVGWGVAAAKVAWLTKAIGVVVLIAAIGLLCAPQLLAYARVRGIGRADRFRLRSRPWPWCLGQCWVCVWH